MTMMLVREETPETQEPVFPPPPDADEPTDRGGPYERITFLSIERSTEARIKTAELTGDSQTDVINRALQVYAYIMTVMAGGGQLFIYKPGEDTAVELTFE